MSKFVVIEGIDGAGTTTQTERLLDKLLEAGRKTIGTFEPTDGPIGSMIRQILRRRLVNPLADGRHEPVDADTMTLLFSADRLDHLKNVIEPALSAGTVVVCDRYYFSTIAYQGVDGDRKWIENANAKARQPDLTFYLRIDPARALDRIAGRPEKEIYEKIDFLSRVSGNYDDLFKEGQSVVILDATDSVEDLSEKIFNRTLGLWQE